jgi:hypothetical protein
MITAGGMAGWQIALIALGAAVVAAAAAVMLDRALAARRGRAGTGRDAPRTAATRPDQLTARLAMSRTSPPAGRR